MANKLGMTQMCVRRLQKEYKDLIKEPIPNIKIYISPDNLLQWYYCIYGLEDIRYKDGEYYGLIQMSPDYPHVPPTYYMYTPSGRFVSGEKICTTNSEYHIKDWKPTWTMDAIFRGFLSLFLEENDTGQIAFNHMRTTISEKKNYARKSKEYNKKHHRELYDVFESNQGVIFCQPPSNDLPSNDSSPNISNGKIKIKLKLKEL